MHTLPLRAGLPALLVGLFVLLLTLGGTPRASAADVNAIKSIKYVTTGHVTKIEIELNSSRVFDARDDALLLQVGMSTFFLSHSPADGSLSTIFFVLTPAQFAATKKGDSVIAYFSTSTPTAADAWDFGPLDKTLLK